MLELKILLAHLALLDFVVHSCGRVITCNPTIRCHLGDNGFWFLARLLPPVGSFSLPLSPLACLLGSKSKSKYPDFWKVAM